MKSMDTCQACDEPIDQGRICDRCVELRTRPKLLEPEKVMYNVPLKHGKID